MPAVKTRLILLAIVAFSAVTAAAAVAAPGKETGAALSKAVARSSTRAAVQKLESFKAPPGKQVDPDEPPGWYFEASEWELKGIQTCVTPQKGEYFEHYRPPAAVCPFQIRQHFFEHAVKQPFCSYGATPPSCYPYHAVDTSGYFWECRAAFVYLPIHRRSGKISSSAYDVPLKNGLVVPVVVPGNYLSGPCPKPEVVEENIVP